MKNESVVFGQRQRIGGEFVQFRVFEAKRRLHGSRRLLLAEDVGDVIGAEGAAGMGFRESRGDGFGPYSRISSNNSRT